MDRREEVIRYVQEKYGRDRVGQIITFGALLSKAAVRDIGRVLQMPYGQVDRLSKLIPVEGVKPVSIEKALTDEPRLREEAKSEEVVNRMLVYAQQVEGLLRNASTHAAGVVIEQIYYPATYIRENSIHWNCEKKLSPLSSEFFIIHCIGSPS